jgi:3-methyladenine DNA glycosylase/8-oxoguanine DNA glycosylase
MPKRVDHTAAIDHLRNVDRRMADLIDHVGPCLMQPRDHTVFYALARSIVYQQLAGNAASAILARVDALFPDGQITAEGMETITDEQLRGAGLSRNKLAALRDLASKTLNGTVPTARSMSHMTDEDIIERCIQVRGIGRWTVEMLLIFRLARPDVLPLDDYGVRKGFQVAYHKRELPTKKDMEKAGRKWKPYRSVASWYLWRAAEM